MAGVAAIGIHNNFPTCKAGVSLWSAYHKAAGGINKIAGFATKILSRDNSGDHILYHIAFNLFQINILMMLRRNYNGANRYWLAVLILYSYLSLAVRPQIRKDPILANFRQPFCQLVSHGNRQRHQFRRLITGKAKHHPLVASPDSFHFFFAVFPCLSFKAAVYSHGNIRRLLINRDKHCAGVTVKTKLSSGITKFLNGVTNNFRNIHIA
ncbi:MAG: hypothetical protein DDT29_01447 [Dehalococcoidia bacterium]|nr:hypothetical protein [Bacillota bacterium]